MLKLWAFLLIKNSQFANLGDVFMVSLIRELCKEHNINVRMLEEELGFGNGTIRRWDERTPSFDKVAKVAKRFNVTVEWLQGKANAKKRPAKTDGDKKTDLQKEAINLIMKLDEKQLRQFIRMIQAGFDL